MSLNLLGLSSASFGLLRRSALLFVRLAFVRWRPSARQHLEEAVQAALSAGRARLHDFLDSVPDALLVKLAVAAHERHDTFLVGICPLEVDRFRIGHFRGDKQLARFCEIPVLRNRVFCRVDVADDFLDGAVLTDQFYGSFWADAPNGIAIVAAQQNAQIDELYSGNNS